MVRNIGGVILGYISMALIIFLTFTGAYLLMGADRAFKPGTYEVSVLWLIVSFLLALCAALIGGYVCAVVARSKGAVIALAVLVLILGIVAAIPALMAASDARSSITREGDVSNLEAAQKAQQPGWAALFNPAVGAVAILVGARLKRTPAA